MFGLTSAFLVHSYYRSQFEMFDDLSNATNVFEAFDDSILNSNVRKQSTSVFISRS